ncbi:hypothetical protein RLV_1852 (plasmid) [Rhizobium leguminosarum bv. viciae]|nr:hypothetical protein RLV_1852 [Rhizobium leguminosarum bv. viciae]
MIPSHACHRSRRQVLQLFLDFDENSFSEIAVGSNDTNSRTNIVLGLGKQIRGNRECICRFISDDKNFAWPGELVDTHLAEYLALRFVDEGVAWTDNLVDRWDRLSAICHGGDGLRATNAEDSVGAG